MSNMENVFDNNKNLQLKKVFNQLIQQKEIELRQLLQDGPTKRKEANTMRFRVSNFKKALISISGYSKDITSGEELKSIKGIGKGTISRINEILETGTLAELSNKKNDRNAEEKDGQDRVVKRKLTIKQKHIIDLQKITGIGPRNAVKLYDLNITLSKLQMEWSKFIEKAPTNSVLMLDKLGNIDRVGKNGKPLSEAVLHKKQLKLLENKISRTKYLKHLNHHQLVGLKYFDDIETRIPRKDIQQIEKLLKRECNKIDTKLVVIIAGSYRRGKLDSGDVDVLISHPLLKTDEDITSSDTSHLIELVNRLANAGFLVDHLTKLGRTKYMGVCKVNHLSLGRRIDIRFVSWISYPAALLYFTGSKEFNTHMRGVALQKGYTLNEYGIYKLVQVEGKRRRVKGNKVIVNSEKDVFDLLGMTYLEPNQR